MIRKALLLGVSLAFLLVTAGMALAANPYLHYFDCKNCHFPNATMASMSADHICLKCHTGMAPIYDPNDKLIAPVAGAQIDHASNATFSTGDASNAFGHNAMPGAQTSHNWAASNLQPAAGAGEPVRTSYAGFYSRYGASNGKVTCTRCHNPHGEAVIDAAAPFGVPDNPLANPKLLIADSQNANKPMDPEKMCRACHKVYADQNAGNHGLLGHPVTSDTYANVISTQSSKYNATLQVPAAPYDKSYPALVNGKVTCLSCHNVHYVDSDSTTVDGVGATLNSGDGNLLKGDGLQHVNDPVRSTTFCNTCHTYTTGFHGTGPTAVGCMGCHGGHNYNSGNPTWYMLNDPTGAYVGGATPPVNKTAAFVGAAGVVDGFCESCHGDVLTWTTANGAGRTHASATEDCQTCHLSHGDGSYSKPIGCNDCHGFPPADATGGGPNATGHAVDVAMGYDYADGAKNGGVTYLNEATTGHAVHARGDAGEHKFTCEQCHNGNTHDDQGSFNPTFQDVFLDTAGFLASSQGFAPTYNGATATCGTNVYCHSDGVSARAGGATPKTVPAWSGGSTDCTSCHNVGTTGTATVHTTHLALAGLGVTCDTCHTKTASDATTLKASALATGGAHVDGIVTVNEAFNTFTPAAFSIADGTCAVYCHSNGTTYVQQPDWDDVNTGDCGDCHGTAAVSPASLSASHVKHFDQGITACDTCHTHDGSVFGGDHINKDPDHDLKVNACGACHGGDPAKSAVDFPADPDRYPVWTIPASVDCLTCHTGTLTATVNSHAAPAVNSQAASGHGKPAGFYPNGAGGDGNPAANKACLGCHDASAPGHYDGDLTDNRLLAAAATCTTSCHGVGGTATSTSGIVTHRALDCAVCHDPHGTGNIFMVKSTSASYSGAVVFTATSGADSYDEADAVNADDICATCHTAANQASQHNNKTNTGVAHNEGTNCFACHLPHTEPTGAFAAGGGDSCDSCHGFPPNTGAHALHAPDSFALDGAGKVYDTADVSACEFCHAGADSYTYNPATDRGNSLNHGNAAGRPGKMVAIGYNDGTETCASACHNLASGQAAAWTATSLACDACHGNPPANGGANGSAHVDHVAHALIDCATCHGSVPTDTAHITLKTGATEALRVQNAAQASADEADLAVATWNDTDNTCATAACHNPSNDGKIAFWGPTTPSTSSCTLCHGDAATMASGSHSKHLALNTACTSCHMPIVGGTGHLNQTVDMQAALNFNANTDDPKVPNTCNSTVCHYNPAGKDGVVFAQETSTWGMPEHDSCTICHESPSAYGDHQPHFSASRVAKGMTCYSCHAGTVDSDNKLIPLSLGGKHLDGSRLDVVFAGTYDYPTVDATVTVISPYDPLVNPSSCSISCHATGNPKVWAPPTSCSDCHGNLTADPRHAAHINIVPSIEADRSECVVCHGSNVLGYQLFEGGSHMDGTLDFAAGIADGGTAPDYTCSTACHVSSAGIDGHWEDTDGLGCDSCHNYPMQDGAHDKHILAGMDCGSCHGVVDPANYRSSGLLTHNHGKDLDASSTVDDGESLTSRGKAIEVQPGVFALNLTGADIHVDDSAYNAGGGSTWVNSNVVDDAGNSCANVLCHNPSATVGKNADWDEDESSCAFCHGFDGGTGPMITSGSHGQHLNAAAKFGINVSCTRCHPDNTGNGAHFLVGGVPNGVVKFANIITGTGVGPALYSGEVDLPSVGVGTCGTNTCHNNGMGGAPITAFTWGTPVATDCQFCHDDPPTSGRHQVHLGTIVNYGPYGGVASTNCGDCHSANNDLTMTGRDTHMNGALNFSDGNSVALSVALNDGIVTDVSVTSCNNCHGAQDATANANAALAKTVWHAGTAPDCGSCHGDYIAANSKADGSGVTAPSRAGSDYNTAGHGKARTPVDALLSANADRAVAKGCVDCHDRTVAHISGALGDVNRLKALSGNNYENLAQRNDWCSGCHNSSAHGHFADTNTPGGGSDDGLYCAVCHDPHGQGGQDAMVASTIQGSLVSGFADRKLRSSYSNGTYTGVCQVCHDNGEVQYFNRTTDSLGSHMGESQCSDCHKHTDNPAFQASGCSGCHGGGYFDGVTTYTNNYWPDSSNARAENTAGRHVKHMERIAGVLYGETIAQLLSDTGNGATDTKQKAICAYCHDGPGVTNHNNGVANVNSMFNLWGAPAAMDNAVWTAGSNSGNCANVNCHNNLTTPNGYGWYGANTTTCTMCHSNTAPDNLAANNIHPSTGLHRIVNTGVVQSHNQTMIGGGCAACHDPVQAVPGGASTHINGIAFDNSNSNDDRFLKATIGYVDAAPNFGSCGGNGGVLFSCHSDKGNWRRLWSKDADKVEYNTPGVPSSGPIWGGARCTVCHGFPDGPGTGWRDGMTVSHAIPGASNNFSGAHATCEYCHVAPAGPYATYTYLSMHENGLIETNNGAGVGYDSDEGSCMNFCHSGGGKQIMGGSTIWNNNPLLGASPTCNECHNEAGGGLLEPYKTSSNSLDSGGLSVAKHQTHVEIAATVYADTTNRSTPAQYSYGCANCHPNNISYHNDGVIQVTLNKNHGGQTKSLNNTAIDPVEYALGTFTAANSWSINSGGIVASGSAGSRDLRCNASYCHSDGKGMANSTTPNWYGGTFASLPGYTGDRCMSCHANSPAGTSHQPHNVGIHYNNIYTGNTGVVKDAALKQNAHGVGDNSTTMSCYLCHNNTIKEKTNARNSVCISCHTPVASPAPADIAAGNAEAVMHSRVYHINGSPDVQFADVSVLSRAQLRDPLSNVPDVQAAWKRQNGYKSQVPGVTSYDETWDWDANLTRKLDTLSMYEPTTKNCTVACHNNVQIGWGATTISCSNCHTQLPK